MSENPIEGEALTQGPTASALVPCEPVLLENSPTTRRSQAELGPTPESLFETSLYGPPCLAAPLPHCSPKRLTFAFLIPQSLLVS